MVDCVDCDFLIITIDEEDLDSYYHCEDKDKHICNLHENMKEIPDWCRYKLRNINE